MTRRAPHAEPLTLPGPAGGLEAVLEAPREPAAALAVVCHPHPLHGGTLHNKVVHTLARSFVRLGARSLRFNFRGVGASEGEHAAGDGEVDDALAAARWLVGRYPGRRLYLAGFSFGALVALRAAPALDCAGLVTVAPPVARLPEPFVRPDCAWLVVQGGADDIVAPADVSRFVAGLADPPRLEIMADAGHFFHGRLPELGRLVEHELAAAPAAVNGEGPC